MGVDDNGQPFTPSDDPMLAQIQGALAGIREVFENVVEYFK